MLGAIACIAIIATLIIGVRLSKETPRQPKKPIIIKQDPDYQCDQQSCIVVPSQRVKGVTCTYICSTNGTKVICFNHLYDKKVKIGYKLMCLGISDL